MKSPLFSITQLLELQGEKTPQQRIVSTTTFDWLYVALGLLVTVGLLMDIWSHTEFGPDQSLFNEYHLLFYGSVSAILVMLVGFLLTNLRKGIPLKSALPQGYGGGLFAALLFGVVGAIDLTGHSLFGFESGIEALTSPTHLLIFTSWFLILFAPVRAARARHLALGTQGTFWSMLPQLISYGAMLSCITMPIMNFFPMGLVPHMTVSIRPDDDTLGILLGIGGTILQTLITVGFILWITREFYLPKGAFTVIFGFYGLYLNVLSIELQPFAMFLLLGISLDLFYAIVKPDASRRIRFLLFSLYSSAMMWAICYSAIILIYGVQSIYYSEYNLFGSIGQAMMMALLLAYLMSMSAGRAIIATHEEKNHA